MQTACWTGRRIKRPKLLRQRVTAPARRRAAAHRAREGQRRAPVTATAHPHRMSAQGSGALARDLHLHQHFMMLLHTPERLMMREGDEKVWRSALSSCSLQTPRGASAKHGTDAGTARLQLAKAQDADVPCSSEMRQRISRTARGPAAQRSPAVRTGRLHLAGLRSEGGPSWRRTSSEKALACRCVRSLTPCRCARR